ncbi:MAG: hypothetical protein ACXAEU_04670 [Candidatus Hodarchaeales archaeon]
MKKEKNCLEEDKQPSLRIIAKKLGLFDVIEAEELLEKLELKVEMFLWWIRGVRHLVGNEITFKEKEMLEIISRAIIELRIEETVPLMFKNPDRKILEKNFHVGDPIPPIYI